MDGSYYSFGHNESLLVKDTCGNVKSSDPTHMSLQIFNHKMKLRLFKYGRIKYKTPFKCEI